MVSRKALSLQSIEREIGVLLHRVRRTTLENARTIHPDLQPAGYSILLFVIDRDGTRASDIVDHFGIDKGAVSRQVAHLERLGLVERSSDPHDRRAHTLVASSVGVERVRALREQRRSVFAGRLSAWTAADLSEFAEQLRRYNASLEA
jgi:DNA-binding MarR family transcriptional regulator